jgi:serine protease AprX
MGETAHGTRGEGQGETGSGARLPCPVCRRHVAASDLVSTHGQDVDLVALVSANTPGWNLDSGLCRECERRFTLALAYLRSHARFDPGAQPILPTHLRLGAPRRYRGRGVTVAFLDAGFHAHPDLVEPRDRILRYLDVTNPKARRSDLATPEDSSWHGMMTSVVACGNGRLSSGLYRGLASEADLVLVKCGSVRRITHEDITKGLLWVLRHRRRYRIRVVNVSCGGDWEASYLHDPLSRAAEALSRAGVLVCAAVGNLGHKPGHPVLPPGSAPSVLTVGGVDDKNRLGFGAHEMYHSSYGPTIDGLQKPEVIAPAIWVAAPILPGTTTSAQAQLLSRLQEAPDAELRGIVRDSPGIDGDLDAAAGLEPPLLRQLVEAKLRGGSVISGHYKHVDGTSFAAPIVSSVAAQMFEANPALTAVQARRILIETARRIPHVDIDRQGWGVVDAGRAVARALELATQLTATSNG